MPDKDYPVDYKKSYLEVCRDFVNFTVKHSDSLDIMCRPWAPDPVDVPQHIREKIPNWTETLPSWIPTLANAAFGARRTDGHFIRVNADPLVGSPGPRGKRYFAGKDTKAAFTPPKADKLSSIFVAGFVLDIIGTTKAEAIAGNVSPSWLIFGDWRDRTAAPPDRFWRTLVADRGPDGLSPPPYYDRACQYAVNQGVKRAGVNAE